MAASSCESSCLRPSATAYTCFVYEGANLRNSEQFSLSLPRISLSQQEPSETLDLEMSASYYCDVDDEQSLFRYRLKLNNFENNVHEFSEEYEYEIVAKALFSNDRHLQLFSQRLRRASDCLEVRGIYSGVRSARARLEHCCFCIRRLNNTVVRQKNEAYKKLDLGSLLLRSGLYSDARLLVGDEEFRVHRRLLSDASPVFRAMFCQEMSERQEGLVRIEDLDAEVVRELLAYVYEGRAAKIGAMPRQLFEAAHKYEIRGLRELCEEHFLFGISCRNLVDILDTARLYELEELAARAMQFLARHEHELVHENQFKNFLSRNLSLHSLAATLKLCHSYPQHLDNLKSQAFDFVKQHSNNLTRQQDFLAMFHSHPDLMRELFVYLHNPFSLLTHSTSTNSPPPSTLPNHK